MGQVVSPACEKKRDTSGNDYGTKAAKRVRNSIRKTVGIRVIDHEKKKQTQKHRSVPDPTNEHSKSSHRN